jgi:hypothetical protein
MAAAPRIPTQRIPAQRGRRSAAPAVPLGSLTQLSDRFAASCSVCGSSHVTRVAMNLTDGTPVDFTSCHRCEHRTWSRTGGDVLGVDAVLEHARKR